MASVAIGVLDEGIQSDDEDDEETLEEGELLEDDEAADPSEEFIEKAEALVNGTHAPS